MKYSALGAQQTLNDSEGEQKIGEQKINSPANLNLDLSWGGKYEEGLQNLKKYADVCQGQYDSLLKEA